MAFFLALFAHLQLQKHPDVACYLIRKQHLLFAPQKTKSVKEICCSKLKHCWIFVVGLGQTVNEAPDQGAEGQSDLKLLVN